MDADVEKLLEKLIEKKLKKMLEGGQLPAPKDSEPSFKVGPLLQSLIDASDRIPSGSRRQGIRFKLGQESVETSIETGLKGEVENILANTRMGDKMTVSKACHALLVLLIEEHRELNANSK
jgi:hypothetical protein